MNDQSSEIGPKFLGQTEIPHIGYTKNINKAVLSRQILNNLCPGKANVYELESKQEAKDYRSMLYSMAILKFGAAGMIGTRIIENVLYVWLNHKEENI